MLKRIAAIVLAVVFLSLAIAPVTLACDRNRRSRRALVIGQRYYNPYRNSGVAGDRYYNDWRRDGIGSTRRAILTSERQQRSAPASAQSLEAARVPELARCLAAEAAQPTICCAIAAADKNGIT